MPFLILLVALTSPKSFSVEDALLEAMLKSWYSPPSESVNDPEEGVDSVVDSEEPENLSWELGSPDNTPDLEIIYSVRCEYVCRENDY